MIRTALIAAAAVSLSIAGGLGLTHAHTRANLSSTETAPSALALPTPTSSVAYTSASPEVQDEHRPKRVSVAPRLVVQTPRATPEISSGHGTTALAMLDDAALTRVVRPLARPDGIEARATALVPNDASHNLSRSPVLTAPAPILGTSSGTPEFQPTIGAAPRRTFARAETSSNITPRYLMGVFR